MDKRLNWNKSITNLQTHYTGIQGHWVKYRSLRICTQTKADHDVQKQIS